MKSVLTVLLLAVLLGFSSCAPPAYVSNKMHIPFFDHQGQGYIEASAVASPTFDFAAGASITDHLMATASANLYAPGTGGELTSLQYYEISGGYYSAFRTHGLLEILGSVGYGSIESQGNNSSAFNFGFGRNEYVHIRSKYNRYSVEGHLGVSTVPFLERENTRAYLEFAGGARISYLSFLSLSQRTQEYASADTVVFYDETLSKPNELFPEFVIMARLHYRNVAFETQFGVSKAASEEYSKYSTILTLGVVYRF